jgi:hypothetical protein
MSEEQFQAAQNQILSRIPDHFHKFLSDLAYEQWHPYGHTQMLIGLGEIVGAFEEPINKYTETVCDAVNHLKS